jgi:hypothetical protein
MQQWLPFHDRLASEKKNIFFTFHITERCFYFGEMPLWERAYCLRLRYSEYLQTRKNLQLSRPWDTLPQYLSWRKLQKVVKERKRVWHRLVKRFQQWGVWRSRVVALPFLAKSSSIDWGSMKKQHQACGCWRAWLPGAASWLWQFAAKWGWDLWAHYFEITWFLPFLFCPQSGELLGGFRKNWDWL